MVSDIVSAILKELEKYSVERVEEVVLVVGDMTSLGEEQLEFAYEIVTKETKLEGSKLVIEHEKIRARAGSPDARSNICGGWPRRKSPAPWILIRSQKNPMPKSSPSWSSSKASACGPPKCC